MRDGVPVGALLAVAGGDVIVPAEETLDADEVASATSRDAAGFTATAEDRCETGGAW